jgi:GNAT superfamily N-acetyltransferase
MWRTDMPEGSTTQAPDWQIREINPASNAEIALVAQRMRQTLVEVEGEATGNALYTMDWLQARVRWHLDASNCTGCVLLAECDDGFVTGHTIVRIEHHADGTPFGLFSTTYVEPTSRRRGIAARLLEQGEAWMRSHRLSESATWTSATNTKLIKLYQAYGYTVTERGANEQTGTMMVRLGKRLII